MSDLEHIIEMLETLGRRLDLLDDRVFGPDVEDPAPLTDPPTGATIDYAGVLYYARDRFNDVGSVGVVAFLTAITETLDEVASAIGGPFADALCELAARIRDRYVGAPPAYMNEIAFGAFFEAMATEAYQYEHEVGRTEPMTLGEFCHTIGSAMHQHLRRGLGVYPSPVCPNPGGLRRPESWASLLGNVQSLAFALGRWYGCFRAPRVERTDTKPIDWTSLPYSVAH